jgi:hypothetical protein
VLRPWQQVGVIGELGFYCGIRDAQNSGGLECTGKCAACASVEQCEVAKEVAFHHESNNALARVEWLVVDGNSNAARQHDVQGVGGIAFLEQHITTYQALFLGRGGNGIDDGGGGGREELAGGNDGSM